MTKKKNPADLKKAGRSRVDGTKASQQPTDKTVYFQVMITASQRDWLHSEAEKLGISAGEMVRQWIQEKQAEVKQ